MTISDPWVILTDQSNAQAWAEIGAAISAPSPEGFLANVRLVSDPKFLDKTRDEVLDLLGNEYPTDFVFIVDSTSLGDDEHSVLVVEFCDGAVNDFRALPNTIQSIENNLSIANLGFSEFTDSVESDGVFRGF